MMKKLSILLVLALAILPLNAFAAAGDAFISSESDALVNDYIQYMTSDGDTLYILGNNLYTYHIGEADLTTYDMSQASADMEMAKQDELNADAEDGEEAEYYGVSYDTAAFFGKDGKLYRLISWTVYGTAGSSCEEATLLEVALRDDGTAEYIPAIEHIDWTELTEDYGDYSYPRGIQSSCVIGDMLFLSVYGMSSGMELYSLDLTSGEVELVTTIDNYMYGMCAYKDDMLLATYVQYNDDGSEMIFCSYDIYGNEEEVGRLSCEAAGQFNSIVYDAEGDMLYGVAGGMVKSLNPNTMEVAEIADMPIANSIDGNKAAWMNGGYYAVGGYDGICVRNLDVSLRTDEIMLRVYNGAYADCVNKASLALGNQDGNIVVVTSTDYMEDSKILENMMNRMETPDIYVMYINSSAYDAIYNRGYMADMNGSDIIREKIASMYEGVQAKLTREGDLVALPVSTYGNTMGINTEALEQLGLTLEDVPTNWLDFLYWLDELADNHPEKMSLLYSDNTFESVKSELFYSLFMDYVHYLGVVGEETGFDTQEMRALLEVLDAMDFEKWGHAHNSDIDYEEYEYVYDEEAISLLETYTNCSLGNMYGSQYQPVLLAISPDTEPILALQTTVAFINPFTQHYDEAVAYMECLAENLGKDVLYAVSPEYNEPTRYSWYAENLQSAQEYLDTLLESYEEIDEEYKQEYETYIAEAREELERVENQWQISPEQIAWYRANGEYVVTESYNALYSGESSEELWTLLEQYFSGTLDSRSLLKQIDKKLQMMILEGR